MIAILLVALFAAVAVTSVATLADAAVRGRNAFRLLRSERVSAHEDRRVTVRFDSGLEGTGPNHDLRTYARAADEVDERAATDASLDRVVAGMREAGVLTSGGTAASMETVHVRITADRGR